MDIPRQMTLIKNPTLERQKNILGVEPKVSLEEGVARVCKRVPERLATGEAWPL
jgi:nucleoside-diphosphate-sugar epimerase